MGTGSAGAGKAGGCGYSRPDRPFALSLHRLDGLPLLALREEQQQQEAVAAAHPVGEAQGEGLHLGQRLQLLELPLPHGRVPALRKVPCTRPRLPRAPLQRGWAQGLHHSSSSSSSLPRVPRGFHLEGQWKELTVLGDGGAVLDPRGVQPHNSVVETHSRACDFRKRERASCLPPCPVWPGCAQLSGC